MTLGAFGAIIGLRTADRPVETVEDLAGLGSTQPLPALGLAICLLSLSGIPPWPASGASLKSLPGLLREPGRELRAPEFAGCDRRLERRRRRILLFRIAVAMHLLRRIVVPRGGWPVVIAVGACASLSLILGLFPAPIAQLHERPPWPL